MRVKLLLAIGLWLSFPGFTQSFQKGPSLLYCSVFENDFEYQKWPGAVGKMDPGIAITYQRGMVKAWDIAISAQGSFTSAARKGLLLEDKKILLGMETSVHLRFLDKTNKTHSVQPFISGGLHLAGYDGKAAFSVVPGAGLQTRIRNTYLIAQFGSRLPVTGAFNRYFYYSLGIGGILTRHKSGILKVVPHPEIITRSTDRDGDGIPDEQDACPDLAGLMVFKGCPDTDGDGIADLEDSCITVMGIRKYHGCPVPDTDRDGISDEEDSCVTTPGFIKYHGCPIPDRDGDGVNDEEDLCVDVPGILQNRGCPPIDERTLEKLNAAAKNILFKTGSYELLPSSFPSLREVLGILNSNEHLKLLIEGHTDAVGNDKDNQLLSENRARTVVEFFKSNGVSASRLKAEGWGYRRPKASNATASGRAENRRVVLHLFY